MDSFSCCSHSFQMNSLEQLLSTGLLLWEWPGASAEGSAFTPEAPASWGGAACWGHPQSSREELGLPRVSLFLSLPSFPSRPRNVTSDWLHSKGIFWASLSFLKGWSGISEWLFCLSSSSTGILGTLSNNWGEGHLKDLSEVGGSSAKYKLAWVLSRVART